MNIVMRQGWIAIGVSIAAMIGSGMLVRSIPYQTAPSAKQAAWLLHCAVLGAVVAPICLLGKLHYPGLQKPKLSEYRLITNQSCGASLFSAAPASAPTLPK